MNDAGPTLSAADILIPPGTDEHSESAVAAELHPGIAPDIEQDLNRLYSNVHSSLAHLRIYGGLESVTHTYLARRGTRPSAILLLNVERNVVTVINEGMTIAEDVAERFCSHVFQAFPCVDLIRFQAIDCRVRSLSFPIQKTASTYEMPLQLPGTAGEYAAGLGKNMRRNLRRYMDKLRREHPSFEFHVPANPEAQEDEIRAIINLNRLRITGKRQTYSIDDEEDRILALARAIGLVGIGRIDGEVCCGAIGYRVGARYFFKIIGHDPRYNAMSLGILTCYLMICACIEQGCTEFNFMWNEYEYKFALGARRRDLESMMIFRSRAGRMKNARALFSFMLQSWRYRAAVLMEQGSKGAELHGTRHIAFQSLRFARAVKRTLSGGAAEGP